MTGLIVNCFYAYPTRACCGPEASLLRLNRWQALSPEER
jgi:hypothetical protein